jgi:hypothetical protein
VRAVARQTKTTQSAPATEVGPALPLGREERLTLSLLQVTAQLHILKGQILETDLRRLPSLRTFIAAGDSLIVELGYGDE